MPSRGVCVVVEMKELREMSLPRRTGPFLLFTCSFLSFFDWLIPCSFFHVLHAAAAAAAMYHLLQRNIISPSGSIEGTGSKSTSMQGHPVARPSRLLSYMNGRTN